MNLKDSISALVNLGKHLSGWLAGDIVWNELDAASLQTRDRNPFFTLYMQRHSLTVICDTFLKKDNLEKWCERYDLCARTSHPKIGIVMAGNIPLVGFHDLICVLLSGAEPVIKLSSKDHKILPVLFPDLRYVNNRELETVPLDGVITMGGESAANYFNTFFPDIPKLIRSSKFSVAVLPQKLSQVEKDALIQDIILYYGLGCRSVTYMFIHESFDIQSLASSIGDACNNFIIPAMRSNFLRNKAVLSMNKSLFFTAGCFILSASDEIYPPVGIINFKKYSSIEEVELFFEKNKDNIQKIYRNFGIAQCPCLSDYPDGKDTMSFCLEIKQI